MPANVQLFFNKLMQSVGKASTASVMSSRPDGSQTSVPDAFGNILTRALRQQPNQQSTQQPARTSGDKPRSVSSTPESNQQTASQKASNQSAKTETRPAKPDKTDKSARDQESNAVAQDVGNAPEDVSESDALTAKEANQSELLAALLQTVAPPLSTSEGAVLTGDMAPIPAQDHAAAHTASGVGNPVLPHRLSQVSQGMMSAGVSSDGVVGDGAVRTDKAPQDTMQTTEPVKASAMVESVLEMTALSPAVSQSATGSVEIPAEFVMTNTVMADKMPQATLSPMTQNALGNSAETHPEAPSADMAAELLTLGVISSDAPTSNRSASGAAPLPHEQALVENSLPVFTLASPQGAALQMTLQQAAVVAPLPHEQALAENSLSAFTLASPQGAAFQMTLQQAAVVAPLPHEQVLVENSLPVFTLASPQVAALQMTLQQASAGDVSGTLPGLTTNTVEGVAEGLEGVVLSDKSSEEPSLTSTLPAETSMLEGGALPVVQTELLSSSLKGQRRYSAPLLVENSVNERQGAKHPATEAFSPLLAQALQSDHAALGDTESQKSTTALDAASVSVESVSSSATSDSASGLASSMGGSALSGGMSLAPQVATQAASGLPQFASSAQTPMEQVLDGTVYSVKNGHKELILRINPDNLGEVRISLVTNSRNELTARLIANTAESRDLLQGQIDSLKSKLEAQGIHVERLSVMLAGRPETRQDFHSGQNSQDAPFQAPHQQQQNASQQQGQGDSQNAFAQMAAGQHQSQQRSQYAQRPDGHRRQDASETLEVNNSERSRVDSSQQAHSNGHVSILA